MTNWRWRAFLATIALVALLSSGLIVYEVVIGTVSRADLRHALLVNCRRDLHYKLQYKLRAEVEKRSLKEQARADDVLAAVARALAQGPPTPLLHTLARAEHGTARSLRHLRGTIHIIPLRGYCAGIGADAVG